MISNSNWTEWSTIQEEIARVISKSDEREALGRFKITSTIFSELYDTRSSLQILLSVLPTSQVVYHAYKP